MSEFSSANQTWNWTHQQLTVLHCLKRCWSICNLKKQNVDGWILIFTLKSHAEIYMYKRITAIFREYLYIGRDINHQIPYFGPNFTHFLRFKKQNQKFESNNSRFVGIEFQLPVLNQPLDIWSSVNSIFFLIWRKGHGTREPIRL